MRFLTQDEKVILVLFVTTALVMLAVSLYLGTNVQLKKEDILSNKIHVIHAGGDIEPDFQEKYKKHGKKMGQFDMHTYDPGINSSDVTPADWNGIAENIGAVYNNYDGFVVVCGKDTMAYTASALSFMLENLGKPVVLTDGELASALLLISKTRIPEVMVASRGNLLRGCRVVHKSTEHFTSPNYQALEPYNSLTTPQEPLQVKFVSPKVKVVVMKVFPGMDAKYLLSVLNDTEIHGIVFEVYGVGHAPITEKILDVIKRLAQRGVVMVAVSQCDEMTQPDVDARLLEAGVLSGSDMTTAAAYAKLCFLLGNVEEKKLIGKLVEQAFRGEMSV